MDLFIISAAVASIACVVAVSGAIVARRLAGSDRLVAASRVASLAFLGAVLAGVIFTMWASGDAFSWLFVALAAVVALREHLFIQRLDVNLAPSVNHRRWLHLPWRTRRAAHNTSPR